MKALVSLAIAAAAAVGSFRATTMAQAKVLIAVAVIALIPALYRLVRWGTAERGDQQ